MNHARFFGSFQHCRRFFFVHRQRLFAENGDTAAESFISHVEMNVSRCGEAHGIKVTVCKHLAVISEHVRDAEVPRDLLGLGLCALAECRNLYTGGSSVCQ
jgi:hypothetical protein